MAEQALWWDMRPAQSRQAKTYTSPICRGFLLAMNPNTLLSPEGDRDRRRHAHTECVAKQRKAGQLLTKAEWERTCQPPQSARRPWWRRLLGSRPPEQGSAR
jgi:hypothetical protein